MGDLVDVAVDAFYYVNVALYPDTVQKPRHHSRISAIAQSDIVEHMDYTFDRLLTHMSAAHVSDRREILACLPKIKPTENLTIVINKSLSDLVAILRLHGRFLLETLTNKELLNLHNDLFAVALYHDDASLLHLLDGTNLDASRFYTTQLYSKKFGAMKRTISQVPEILDYIVGSEHEEFLERLCCAHCGNQTENLRHCASCLSVVYCDTECMNAHWPTHKRDALCKARRKIGKN